MNEILLFHHGQGLTDGVLAFAETLRSAGHTVHTPDYYDGRVFATLDEGVAYRDEIGIPELANRAVAAAASLPNDLVYAGFSLGTGPAQLLAQTRPGARGALLMSGCLPSAAFETPWPTDVALAVHTTEHDPWVDLDSRGVGRRGGWLSRAVPGLGASLRRPDECRLRRRTRRATRSLGARVAASARPVSRAAAGSAA